MSLLRFFLIAPLLFTIGACEPSVVLTARSPDQLSAAWVAEHVSIDPPAQSIWVRTRAGEERMVQRLGEDSEWCESVVWSNDSDRVAFLISGTRLVVADAATGKIVLDRTIVDGGGDYPAGRVAENLAFVHGGQSVRFDDCARGESKGERCGERVLLVR